MTFESSKLVIRDFFTTLSNGHSNRMRELMHFDVAWTLLGARPLAKVLLW